MALYSLAFGILFWLVLLGATMVDATFFADGEPRQYSIWSCLLPLLPMVYLQFRMSSPSEVVTPDASTPGVIHLAVGYGLHIFTVVFLLIGFPLCLLGALRGEWQWVLMTVLAISPVLGSGLVVVLVRAKLEWYGDQRIPRSRGVIYDSTQA